MLLSISNAFAQKSTTCEVVVWKGRKAHYTAEKIALYTGKDVKNSAVVFYDDYSFKTQVWRKNEIGDNKIDAIDRLKPFLIGRNKYHNFMSNINFEATTSVPS